MDSINLTLVDLNAQLSPNIRATAKKFNLVESTLRRRWNSQIMSRKDAFSEYKQRLTNVQEKALISQINHLTNRSIPPISRMIRNLVEELIRGRVRDS